MTALKRKGRALITLCTVSIALTACGDGRRHYRSGHPISNTFEIFSFENPLAEIRGVLLYMVLPVIIGTILSFVVSYLWTMRSNSEIRATSLLPRSVMRGIVLAAFGYMIAFVARSSIHQLLPSLILSFVLVWPALLIIGTLFLIDFLTRRASKRLPIWFLYGTSLIAVIAEYFWLGELLQA
jgi:hypothetical protein